MICEPVCFRRSQCYAIGTYLAGPYGGGVRWVRTNPPPSGTCGKQKSEPNHFVAVQELIEGSELEVSLKRLKFPSVYALYHRTVLHLVMTSLGDCNSSHRFRGQWELFRNVTPFSKPCVRACLVYNIYHSRRVSVKVNIKAKREVVSRCLLLDISRSRTFLAASID